MQSYLYNINNKIIFYKIGFNICKRTKIIIIYKNINNIYMIYKLKY